MPECSNFGDFDFGPLRSLENETPATRMAFVRRLWPQISAGLDAGHNLVVVHQRLAAGGFDIPYSTLAVYVNRIRLEQARTKTSRTRPVEKTSPKRTQPPPSQARTDPLANLEKYGTANLPGFHFTGEPPDPDKLF
jgi:hypothetical protein